MSAMLDAEQSAEWISYIEYLSDPESGSFSEEEAEDWSLPADADRRSVGHEEQEHEEEEKAKEEEERVVAVRWVSRRRKKEQRDDRRQSFG